MGIPHLTTYLRPHAEVVQWKVDSAPAERVETRLVIDGPAFAYHIYYQCLNRNARHALEAIPSYQLLQSTAVSWLNVFERLGLNVKSIYFDGYLPEEKKPVRRSRLEKSIVDLQKFKNVQSDPIPYRLETATENKSNSGFGRVPIPAKLKAIPAAPFLVPAIIEALLSSEKYKGKVFVVPYEADDYCVRDCVAPDTCVFTSDSDLLVKCRDNGGQPAGVIFFQDLEVTETASGVSLRALCFRPHVIAETLGVDLTDVGWALCTYRSYSLKQCISKISNIEVPSDEFEKLQKFKEDAVAKPWPSHSFSALLDTYSQKTGSEHSVGRILRTLDPRISELVVQAVPRYLQQIIAGDSDYRSAKSPVESFLPFLIDDPSRASAWRASSSIRALALSVLHQLDNSFLPVFQADRHGSRMVSTPVAPMSAGELTTASKDLGARIQTRLATLKFASLDDSWRISSLILTLEMLLGQDMPMPSLPVVTHLLGQQHKKHKQRTSWVVLHLHAQIHATMYSIRMLQQTLAVYVAFYEPGNSDEVNVDEKARKSGPALLQLKSCLDSLPRLGSLFGHICGPLVSSMAVGSAALRIIAHQFYGLDIDKGEDDKHQLMPGTSVQKGETSRGVGTSMDSSKRSKKRKTESPKQSQEVKHDPGNRFSALDIN